MPFDYSSEIKKYVNVMQRGSIWYKIENMKESILRSKFFFLIHILQLLPPIENLTIFYCNSSELIDCWSCKVKRRAENHLLTLAKLF
jgi:hypothetical protein